MAIDRSPKAPRNSLKDAVAAVEKLFAKARRAAITREAAANAIGYSGLTGSSMTLIASLLGYGLLERRGQNVSVSDRAIAILHPKNEEAKMNALKEAALANPIFQQLHEDYLNCDQSVIESHLIHLNFSPDAAKKTASVFTSNSEFASLIDSKYSTVDQNEIFRGSGELIKSASSTQIDVEQSHDNQTSHYPHSSRVVGKIIAEISVPLAGNQLSLVLQGNDPVLLEDIDDIDSLIEYLKRQLKKKVDRSATPILNKISENESSPYP